MNGMMAGDGLTPGSLRLALARGEIVPWYQPLVCGRSGAPGGCEVLARWPSPRHGLLLPDHFIGLAERDGLIIALTRRLMQQVARDLGPAAARLPAGFHLAFNIGPRHAAHPELIADCRALQAALAGCGVQIVAELTEREPLTATPAVTAMLATLHAAGVRVALDDFGTGYAGLACLDELDIDIIKLDRRFTARTGGAADGASPVLMAELVIGIAARRGLEVVAEGVETPAQQAWLCRHGVRWQQGYLFAPPLPAPEFLQYLRRARRDG